MHHNVTIEINGIIKDALGMDIIEMQRDDEHFFSKGIGIAAREMIAVLFDIEKKFEVSFTEEEIQSDDFYTLTGISRIIHRKTQ